MELLMNPEMKDYWDTNDMGKRDLPMYSYDRLAEWAQLCPAVPVPLYGMVHGTPEDTFEVDFTTDVRKAFGAEIYVFRPEELEKIWLIGTPLELCDLHNGEVNWIRCFKEVYETQADYRFSVSGQAFRECWPDGSAYYCIMTAEEAAAMDLQWRKELKKKGHRTFLEHLELLAKTEEEKRLVFNHRVKAQMLGLI